MIYLNNAATTYPKPQCVLDAHAAALCALPDSQYRSAAQSFGIDVFTACRESLGKLFHITDTDRIFFSSGATDSANRIINGLYTSGLCTENSKIAVTQTEHNSILRPLMNHPVFKNNIVILPCDKTGKVDITKIDDMGKNQNENQNNMSDNSITGVLFLNHCSNVTGKIQDMKQAVKAAKKAGLLVIADVSQSAGCIPIDVEAWGLDGLIFTGHKSLLGVQGTGGYYIRCGINIKPMFYGGTGRDSSQLTYENGDYEFEVGTQNAPGIAALFAGVSHVLETGVETIAKQEQKLMEQLYAGLNEVEGVTLYGSADDSHGPVMSFTILGLKASDVTYILQSGYEIITRAGLHCAPLIHEAMGTKTDGTVRASVSPFTTKNEIDAFIKAVKEICRSVK